jgi:lysozyme
MPNPLVVDLSHYNSNVDFAAMRAGGVAGVIHKATQGTGYVDPTYAQRKPLALQAGLLWGAYHFGTNDDAGAQADHFLSTVQPDGSVVLVLDFESNGAASMSLAQAKQFLQAVAARTGQQPVLYTGGYMNQVCGSTPDPALAQYRVWWAQYASAPKLHPTWSAWWLWQYSDGSAGPSERSVPGGSPCDCNAFGGTAEALASAWR